MTDEDRCATRMLLIGAYMMVRPDEMGSDKSLRDAFKANIADHDPNTKHFERLIEFARGLNEIAGDDCRDEVRLYAF